MKKTKNKFVSIYARVSTDKQKVDMQLRELSVHKTLRMEDL